MPLPRLRFNSAGRCTAMPAQETLNPSALVPSYPVVERRYVWVWVGDPNLADPNTVPDMHQMDDPAWAGDGETIHADCNYAGARQPDGPHPREFVHSSSIGQELSRPTSTRSTRAYRHRHPVDAQRRRTAFLAEEHARQVPGLRGQGRPLADHQVRGAEHDPHRRGVARPAPARPRVTAARASAVT